MGLLEGHQRGVLLLEHLLLLLSQVLVLEEVLLVEVLLLVALVVGVLGLFEGEGLFLEGGSLEMGLLEVAELEFIDCFLNGMGGTSMLQWHPWRTVAATERSSRERMSQSWKESSICWGVS